MKNADMPAMPLTGDTYLDLKGGALAEGKYEDGMGLTKREMFAKDAPEIPREFYWEFFHKYNSCDVSGFISQDEPCLTAKGILAANKEWRYAYADLMLGD